MAAQNWVILYNDNRTCLASDVLQVDLRTTDLHGTQLGEKCYYFMKVIGSVIDSDVSVMAKFSEVTSYREQY